jgi:hypothetical protein
MTDLVATATQLKEWLYGALKNDKGLHVETLVSSASRLSGAALLRSFNLDLSKLQPGSAVFSDLANEAGPQLMNYLGSMLTSNGIALDNDVAGADPGPDHASQLHFTDTLAKLGPEARAILARAGLDDALGARALILACAMIIFDTREVVDPSVSFGIAIAGLVEGSKTVPPP